MRHPAGPRHATRHAFERLLVEVQDAFGREDYARLRGLTMPEIMSHLPEALGQNATKGLRNDVAATRLLDAEVAEARREAAADYATIVRGSAATPAETAELCTFVRDHSGIWNLSAIEEG